MDFLSNIFSRLFGKKKEDDQNQPQPLVQATPPAPRLTVQSAPAQPQPQIIQPPQPTINPASLAKANPVQTPAPVQQVAPTPAPAPAQPEEGGLGGALQKLKSYFSFGSDNALQRGIEKAGNFIEGGHGVALPKDNYAPDAGTLHKAAGWAYNSLIKPIGDSALNLSANLGIDAGRSLSGDTPVEGHTASPVTSLVSRIANKSAGNQEKWSDIIGDAGKVGGDVLNIALPGAGENVLASGLEKALPEVMKEGAITGLKFGAGSGYLNGLDENRDEPVPSQLVKSLVPAAEGAVTGAVAGGVLPVVGAGVRKIFGSLFNRGGEALAADVTEVAPGVKTNNPEKIATLTARPENPNAGQLNNPFGNQTVEDAMLAQPTLERNIEAAQLQKAQAQAAVPGPRTLTDVTGRELSTQDMHAPDALQEVPNPQVFARSADQPLNVLHQPFPEVPAPRSMTDLSVPQPATPQPSISVPEIQQIAHSTGKFSNVSVTNDTFPQTDGIDDAVAKTNPITRELTISAPALEGDVQHLLSGKAIETPGGIFKAKPGETAAQLSQRYLTDSVLPYEAEHPQNLTIDQAQRMTSGDSPAVAKELDAQAIAQTAPVAPIPDAQPAAIPEAPIGTPPVQAPAAPDLRQAMVNSLGDAAKTIAKDSPNRDALVIKETMDRARGMVNDADPAELVRMYTENVTPESLKTLVRTPQEYAFADASLRKLYDLAKNGDQTAASAAENILSAMQFGSSKSAQFLRITQQAFDDMPVPMKINRVLGYIDRANAEKFGPDSPQVAALKDPAKRTMVTQQMDGLFTIDQQIRDDVASAENVLDQIKSNPAAYTRNDVAKAATILNAATDRLASNTRDFAKVYEGLVPGAGDAIDKIGDYQRTAMLSSIAGRVQDVIQTTGNALREIGNSKVEGAIGKVLNIGRPGTFLDKGLSVSDLVKAVPAGLEKSGQEFRGEVPLGGISDVVQGIHRNPDRTDITGANKGFFTRLVKAGTNFATNLTGGVGTSEESRLLRQEGQQAGFTGKDLDTYTRAASANPAPQIAAKAEAAAEKVNNINQNPFTDFMRSIGNSAEKNLGKTGKFIKNALLPFPTWVGGNMWNSITDRNVIANGLKAIYNVNRDPQYAVQQLSKAITGTAEAYGLGYALSHSGVITDKDAEGNSYDGLYLHVGSHYVPISSLGAFAPNLILGYSAYKSFNNDDGEADGDTTLKNIADTAVTTISKAFPAFNVSQLTGGDSYLSRGVEQFATDPQKALSTLGAGFLGQFIPSATNDVNAVLNNYTDLNPTHEAADTKVVNPDSPSGEATDPVGTAINQIKNKIPFLSQELPRKEGVAASDLIDRVTRGDHDTDTSIAVRDEAKAVVDQSKDFKARGIPDYNGKYKDGATFDTAVETKIENGDYPAAIEGLQAKLDHDKQNSDIPKSTIKTQQDAISRLQVASDGKFDPSVIPLYKDTSLAEWRDMGDPESDAYDPAKYQLLWDYDGALAKKSVSRNTTSADMGFYSPKKPAKGSKNGVSTKISSNTIGNPIDLGKVNLSKISAQAIQGAPIPKITVLKPSDLVKKRKISVSNGL